MAYYSVVASFNSPLNSNRRKSPSNTIPSPKARSITTSTKIGLDPVGIMGFTSEAKIGIATGTTREDLAAITTVADVPIQLHHVLRDAIEALGNSRDNEINFAISASE